MMIFFSGFAYNMHSKIMFSGTENEFTQIIYNQFGVYNILIFSMLFLIFPWKLYLVRFIFSIG